MRTELARACAHCPRVAPRPARMRAVAGMSSRGSRSACTPATQTMEAPVVRSKLFLDEFADKLFDDGAELSHIGKQRFVDSVEHEHVHNGVQLQPGYADFCKHLFVRNFTGSPSGMLRINESNKHLLETDYVARREGELPVLTRWFPKERVQRNQSAYLDVILYSRQQIEKERNAMQTQPERALPEGAEWGIISVKFQDYAYELPMEPITMLRNALGTEEGGSGVPLDRSQYDESVAYWREHARVA